MAALHAPVTVTDEYLAAIHGVLTEIRDRLPESPPQPAAGTVTVSEPAKPAAAKKTPRREQA
jgi:hypothetical protein